jgi:hypothetical protein
VLDGAREAPLSESDHGKLRLIFYTIVSEVIDYQHVAVFKMA